MLPTSHHLAFAVQYITLSGVLLLRCVAYGNQENLVEAVIVDAEKCVKLLEGMEGIWNGAKRCKEIVSDLLVVVRTRHYGGLSALDALQTTGDLRYLILLRDKDFSTHTLPSSGRATSGSAPPETTHGKRKFPDEFEIPDLRSRPRLDGPQSQCNSSAPQPSFHRGSSQLIENRPQHHGKLEPPPQDSIILQRLSNVRTPVDHDGHEQPPQYGHRFNVQRTSEQTPGISIGPMPPIVQQTGNSIAPQQHLQYQDAPPRISLDLNALSAGREIDGLPYSGYDFLSDDVYALLGSVFRPQNEQLAQNYEENGQMLWQMYGQAGSNFGLV